MKVATATTVQIHQRNQETPFHEYICLDFLLLGGWWWCCFNFNINLIYVMIPSGLNSNLVCIDGHRAASQQTSGKVSVEMIPIFHLNQYLYDSFIVSR